MKPSARTRSTPASPASTCRTRRSPRAWAPSPTAPGSASAPATPWIIKSRRRAINAARSLQEGVPAPGVDNPELYSIRSGDVILKRDVDWLDGTEELRKGFADHPELLPANA